MEQQNRPFQDPAPPTQKPSPEASKRPFERPLQPSTQLPTLAPPFGGVPPIFFPPYGPGAFLPMVAPSIPGFE